jgi:hypothetical protein
MRRAASRTWIGLTLLVLGMGCSSQDSPPLQGQGGHENLAGRTGSGGMGTSGKASGGDTGAAVCCPPDPTHNNGCMHLGGAAQGGMCWETCDFWCSTNWRIEPDAQGCPEWRYDSNGPCFDAFGVPVDAGSGN